VDDEHMTGQVAVSESVADSSGSLEENSTDPVAWDPVGSGPDGWTEAEQRVANRAFAAAYARSIATLLTAVRGHVATIDTAEKLWDLHDFLSVHRHRIEGRFDSRQPALLFVFADLVREGLLTPAELEGLDSDKQAKIAAMVRMC
jgi:hypothetical protein